MSLGDKLFRFAVISDTHVNPSETECNSPFPVNARANRRFRHVIRDLNQRDLSFVIHLGDLVHPVPSSGAAYQRAADAYHQIAAELQVPMHVIPGNHDIGDKPGAGGPVPAISKSDIAAWTATFGTQNKVVRHGDLQCLMLNAQLINSGLADEATQKNWAETQIAEWTGRTMLMLHHPPFICSADEAVHYDNLANPGRSWVLELMNAPGIVATFAGHAHNFWYDQVGGHDYYRLPATSFVRQDYAEMLRAAPEQGSEFGRDDKAKLGYLVVDVFENGHTVQIVRTFGAECGPDDATHKASRLANPPLLNASAKIGFDLRQNWAELTEIAPSAALDEFDRKVARNDYPLMALIEMGVRDLRLPMSDLRDKFRRDRLAALRSSQSALTALHRDTKLDIFLSPIHDPSSPQGGIHRHVIEHGFRGDEKDCAPLIGACKGHIQGLVFRQFCTEITSQSLSQIAKLAAGYGLKSSVHLRTGTDSPAVEQNDTGAVLRALKLCADQALKAPAMRFFLDTLIQQDRGYFPRPGALDVRCNPTEITHFISDMHGA